MHPHSSQALGLWGRDYTSLSRLIFFFLVILLLLVHSVHFVGESRRLQFKETPVNIKRTSPSPTDHVRLSGMPSVHLTLFDSSLESSTVQPEMSYPQTTLSTGLTPTPQPSFQRNKKEANSNSCFLQGTKKYSVQSAGSDAINNLFS